MNRNLLRIIGLLLAACVATHSTMPVPFLYGASLSEHRISFECQALANVSSAAHMGATLSPNPAVDLVNVITPMYPSYQKDFESVLPTDDYMQVIGLGAMRWRKLFPGNPLGTVTLLIGGWFSWIYKVTARLGDLVWEIPAFNGAPEQRAERFEKVEKNYAYFKRFHLKGLKRYLPEPTALMKIPLRDLIVPVAITQFFNGYSSIDIAEGQLRIFDPKKKRFVPFPTAEVPNILAEIVAAIAYHFEFDGATGTTLSDFQLESGDILLCRLPNTAPDLKLIAVRNEKSEVNRNHYLYSLMTLTTWESMWPDPYRFSAKKKLEVSIPVPISNPSIALEGLARALERRHQDLKHPEPQRLARQELEAWAEEFVQSDWGRPYKDSVTQFLAGDLPPRFGDNPLEGQPSVEHLQGLLEEVERDEKALPPDARELRKQYRTVTSSMRNRLEWLVRRAPSTPADNETFDTDVARHLVERGLSRAFPGWSAQKIDLHRKIWVPILEQGIFVAIALITRWNYGAQMEWDARSGSWIPWLVGPLYGYLHKRGFSRGARIVRGLVGLTLMSMYWTGGGCLVVAPLLATSVMIAVNLGYHKLLWREAKRRAGQVGEMRILKGLSLLALAACIWLTHAYPWEWLSLERASHTISIFLVVATLAGFGVAGLMGKWFPHHESIYLPIRRVFVVSAFYAFLWAFVLPSLLFGSDHPRGLLPVLAVGSTLYWGINFTWRFIRERLAVNLYRRFTFSFTRYRKIYIPPVDRWTGVFAGVAVAIHAIAWVLGVQGPWTPMPTEIVPPWTPGVLWEMLWSIAFQAGFVLWCVNDAIQITDNIKLPRRYDSLMRRLLNMGRASLTGWFLFVLPGAVLENLFAAFTTERLPYRLLHIDWLFGPGHAGDISDLYYVAGLTLLAMAVCLALLFGEDSGDGGGSDEGRGRGGGPTASFTFEFTTENLEARAKHRQEVPVLTPAGPVRRAA